MALADTQQCRYIRSVYANRFETSAASSFLPPAMVICSTGIAHCLRLLGSAGHAKQVAETGIYVELNVGLVLSPGRITEASAVAQLGLSSRCVASRSIIRRVYYMYPFTRTAVFFSLFRQLLMKKALKTGLELQSR